MKNLRERLNLLLRYMELGGHIRTLNGHTLVMDTDCDEPGFQVNSNVKDETWKTFVVSTASDQAWMELVLHARKMNQDQTMNLSMVVGLEEDRQMRRSRG